MIDFLFGFEACIVYMLGCILGLVVFVLATEVIDNRDLIFLKLKNIVKNKNRTEATNTAIKCCLCCSKQNYAVAVFTIGYANIYVCKEHAEMLKKFGYEVDYNSWR